MRNQKPAFFHNLTDSIEVHGTFFIHFSKERMAFIRADCDVVPTVPCVIPSLVAHRAGAKCLFLCRVDFLIHGISFYPNDYAWGSFVSHWVPQWGTPTRCMASL